MNRKHVAWIASQSSPGQPGANDVPVLLTTKITPPRRGRGVLPRPRLEQFAEHLTERRLAILEAPPGFGKTTLATIWAERLVAQGHAVAWLSLDAEDDSAHRLLYYLSAAINRVCSSVGKQVLALGDGVSAYSAQALASLLIAELERHPQPITLIFDDYHCIDDAVLVEALRFLVQRAPEQVHLVFIGRKDLPEAILEHFYADERLEIDGALLRFQPEETRDLLRKGGLQPELGGDLCVIQEAADGWIAALRAYLLTTNTSGGRHLPRSISNLFDDILAQLSDSTRRTLCALGLLEKFSPALLHTLFGDEAAEDLLQLLRRRQLFLNVLDEHDGWFGLHPLFRDHLRSACLRQDEVAARQFLLQAARWFAERELWFDAIQLGMDSGDVEQLREWIQDCATTLIEQGDFNTLVALEKRWKLQSSDNPLPLKVTRAWAMGRALEHGPAMRLAEELEAEIAQHEHSEEVVAMHWEVQAIKTMLWALDDRFGLAAPLADACLASGHCTPWATNVLRNVVCGTHIRACRWDRLYALPPTQGVAQGNRGYFLHDCYRKSLYALAEFYQGRIVQGMATLDGVLEQAHELFACDLRRPNPVLTALPKGFGAVGHYLRGEHSEAESLLVESMSYIKSGSFIECIAFTHMVQVRLLAHQGRFAQARRVLDDLESLALAREWPRLQARALLERVRLHLLERKPREANVCSSMLQQLASLDWPDQSIDREYFALLSRLWLALDVERCEPALLDQAVALLQRMKEREIWLYYVELGSVTGLLLSRERGMSESVELLGSVLTLTAESGVVTLLSDLPTPDACGLFARHCPVALQLQAAELLGIDAQESAGDCSEALLALTVKERQVVQLVAEGKSNKQIARDLNVTPETIKSHMKNIFAKLKVDNRAQAAVMLQQHATI
ncbi:LuxR C-terminal-related transcriptional regulator [Halopseudomonas sp.]|uniref:LuxR C-terminal-related transcriptional regulator n=1 Tax=Halopseudomonas sp. TaxID=2901191 RepID=UPI00311DBCBE